jgi:glycerophosphoryl diester phosphodiesterase
MWCASVCVALVLTGMAAERATMAPYSKPTLIAHRGASFDAPEHTIAAYRLAIAQGADLVEPDLQFTRDGVLVCLHDTTLQRTTNVADVYPDRAVVVDGKKTWPVGDFTLAEVQRLDAGSWKDSKFAGARVPTFQEMLDEVKGKAGVIPETKAPDAYQRRGLDMEKALIEVLARNGLDRPGADPRTPVIIQSFSEPSLRRLRDVGCRLPRLLLLSGDELTLERLEEIKTFADGIAPAKRLIYARPEIVQEAHGLGMSVTVWTFRSGHTDKFANVRDEMAHFLDKLQVDALFTDHPDRFPR